MLLCDLEYWNSEGWGTVPGILLQVRVATTSGVSSTLLMSGGQTTTRSTLFDFTACEGDMCEA